ncbi:hypothetical protein AAFF_G00404720 [Aldrovandia affinis]|uniref:Uncharacterized protein n=1 Tax=Aldrovandia affinis TaxID=143900 RepID=A0AAD7T7Y5_9TELE|nr:hypothetical protein AAFF_G00404720 [Aldrovandia affinis]
MLWVKHGKGSRCTCNRSSSLRVQAEGYCAHSSEVRWETGVVCEPRLSVSIVSVPPGLMISRSVNGSPILAHAAQERQGLRILWLTERAKKEWDELFLNSNYLAGIRQSGINGRLRSGRFRSVCWKVEKCMRWKVIPTRGRESPSQMVCESDSN